jgi:hypothetical protein
MDNRIADHLPALFERAGLGEYRLWIPERARAQTLYLLAVEGVRC